MSKVDWSEIVDSVPVLTITERELHSYLCLPADAGLTLTGRPENADGPLHVEVTQNNRFVELRVWPDGTIENDTRA